MTSPFQPGDDAAFLTLDVQGMRVNRTTVTAVEDRGEGNYDVTTDVGTFEIRDGLEHPQLVPADESIQADWDMFGDGYLVISTYMDLGATFEQSDMDQEVSNDGIDI